MVTVDSFSGNKTLNADWQKKKIKRGGQCFNHRRLKCIYCSFIIPLWGTTKDINMSCVCKLFFFFGVWGGSAVKLHLSSKTMMRRLSGLAVSTKRLNAYRLV